MIPYWSFASCGDNDGDSDDDVLNDFFFLAWANDMSLEDGAINKEDDNTNNNSSTIAKLVAIIR